MSKYKGYYWTLFAPMMKKSIAQRYSKELAEAAIKKENPSISGFLPMRMNSVQATRWR